MSFERSSLIPQLFSGSRLSSIGTLPAFFLSRCKLAVCLHSLKHDKSVQTKRTKDSTRTKFHKERPWHGPQPSLRKPRAPSYYAKREADILQGNRVGALHCARSKDTSSRRSRRGRGDRTQQEAEIAEVPQKSRSQLTIEEEEWKQKRTR
ncbi:hypothetical protein F2Q70_00038400 [Brassica cretica]|uniref:Uncharacterized protein n=1 Tax=Brassica cretica TaxID=69181 RepID=A0A8S9KA09_BRACR|nr:hypothetical protein F2Q70_00038400 [Brassica cretica]